jgi:hypothetical protein
MLITKIFIQLKECKEEYLFILIKDIITLKKDYINFVKFQTKKKVNIYFNAIKIYKTYLRHKLTK